MQEALQAWSWPGNVRELRNVMERAFLLCEDGIIRIRDLPADIRSAARPGDSPPGTSPENSLTEKVSRVEEYLIDDALKETNGNIHEAARNLRVTYRMLYYKMFQSTVAPSAD